MSIFVNESAMPIGNPIDADTSYFGESGAYTLLAENVMNDMAMFNLIIAGDFAESKAIHENASSDQLMVLTENAGTRLIENIKAFLKKAYEKIKGLILSFIDRMTTVVIRDNKKLVEKYRSQVLGKDLATDKFKYKWSVAKAGKDIVYPKNILIHDRLIDAAKAFQVTGIENIVFEEDGYKAFIEKESGQSEYLGKLFSLKEVDFSNSLKDLKEQLFEDSDQQEGLSRALLSSIMSALTGSKDLLDSIKKAQGNIDKIYRDYFNTLDKLKVDIERKITKSDHGSNQETVGTEQLRALNTYYEFMKLDQAATTKAISTVMSVTKFRIAESRAVFVRAVSFRGKTEALNNSGNLFVESSDASNDVVEGDKDTTVEINIEIEDPQNEPELVEAIEDESDAIVEEQFHGGYDY